jgi:MFS family permease
MSINALWCYALIFSLNGAFQSTGWPLGVTLIGQWFPTLTRGAVFGFWSSNTSIGNICGSLLVSLCLYTGLSIPFMFLLPAACIGIFIILTYILLPQHPARYGFHIDEPTHTTNDDQTIEETIGIGSHLSPEEVETEPETSQLVHSPPIHRKQFDNVSVVVTEIDEQKYSIHSEPSRTIENEKSVTILQAIMLPNVIVYSLAYACIKVTNEIEMMMFENVY